MTRTISVLQLLLWKTKKIAALMEPPQYLTKSQTTICVLLAQCAHRLKAAHCCKISWNKVVLRLKSKKRSFAHIIPQRLTGQFFVRVCHNPPPTHKIIQKIS